MRAIHLYTVPSESFNIYSLFQTYRCRGSHGARIADYKRSGSTGTQPTAANGTFKCGASSYSSSHRPGFIAASRIAQVATLNTHHQRQVVSLLHSLFSQS